MRTVGPKLTLSALVVGLALASGAATCGDQPNELSGSLEESFDLAFDRVELRRFDGVTYQLDYLKDLEGDEVDIVVKVVFDAPEGGVVVDEEIDILDHNGIIERRASDNVDFPPLERGTITFSEGGSEPGPAKGRFVSTFTSGETLNGNFDTELEDVEF